MSGFEIAGVVLGALPLLISAAEHYQSGLDPAIAFFKWKDELKKALRELWLQHSSFQLTLRNLLKEVASPSETDEMLSDFQHELWKSSELANRLERRLHVAYKVYIYMMQEMESCLRTLAGHLDIDRKKGTLNDLDAILQANPPALSSGQGPPRFEFRSRIKFTMRRKEIRNLLKEIKSCNERLDQFIEKAQKTQPAPQHAEKPKICPTVQQIQEYATNLHEILSGAWSCAPRGSHQVHLILEHRMVRPKKELALRVSHDDQDTACFTLSCSGPSSPENWNLAEIRVTAKTTSHQPQVSKNKPVSKSLSPVSNSNGSAAGKTQIVKDLCPFFCRQSHPGCLGFELNPDGKLWGVYQAESRTILHSESCVTLEEILFPPQDNNQCKPFTEEDRYVLAITIASSMLQLHVTPWLTGYWSKRNILFTRHTDTQQVVVDISHPFISMDYQQKSGNNSDPTATAQNLLDSYDDDSMNLLTLAKLLLEIKLGNKFQYPSPGDKNGHASDFLELKRWIVREKGNLSFAYRDAVSYCMQCAVNPAIELKDAGFRQKMVDYVVVPLLNDLDYWRGGVL